MNQSAETANRQLRVAVIGLGNMGANHVRVLSTLKNAQLSFVHDIDPAVSAEVAQRFGTVSSTDLEQDLSDVDAVVVATPTSTHLEWVERLAPRVPNIFIEKPLGSNHQESSSIRDLVEKHKNHVQVGFIERYNPTIVGLRRVLTENKKRIINIDFTRTNKLSSRITDVDVVVDLMIHDIDLALYLVGDISDVSAYGVVEDGLIAFAAAVLKHKSGVFSRLTASRITEKRIRQINLTCDDMYIDCDLLRKEILINKQSVVQAYKGVSLNSTMEAVQLQNQEPLLSEHIDFVYHSIGLPVPLQSATPPDTGAGLNASRIADSIKDQITGNA